ncbi:tripartite tricarboxylate transporter TctB family protein [Roseomonas sp. SSH11]|uniref:Tripartite tricarboxylate transporter TctB family protein n=1 Tax=Pararoseomonas baculiformis TaxID=2820812 RepID=A0ABS4AI48_9PROT|nr:tripartite tricarboxylate transporter TctB family protein [Pararoseomonas baculiformis]MBP0446546.1 tripartite tricarboxylate transporter TctB family protein [Pararoseomonas baculiformis]
MKQPIAPAGTPGADLAVGLFVMLLGALTLYAACAIPDSPLYAQVGAKAVPYLVGVILVLLGGGLSAVALRGGWSRDNEEAMAAPPTNWRALALLGAGLLVQVALIGWLGFVIAATIQYVLVCAAFGSRRPVRDLAIGIAVTLGAYLGFSRLLGVNIGAGVLEGLL